MPCNIKQTRIVEERGEWVGIWDKRITWWRANCKLQYDEKKRCIRKMDPGGSARCVLGGWGRVGKGWGGGGTGQDRVEDLPNRAPVEVAWSLTFLECRKQFREFAHGRRSSDGTRVCQLMLSTRPCFPRSSEHLPRPQFDTNPFPLHSAFWPNQPAKQLIARAQKASTRKPKKKRSDGEKKKWKQCTKIAKDV
jgi:hypothetical protein